VSSDSVRPFSFPVDKPSNTPGADHIYCTIGNWDKKTVEAELKPAEREGSVGFFASF
jgi:hypothetical protein